MENRMTEIISGKNKNIKLGIIPGHFATNHSHVNYYIDMDGIKCLYKMAKETAKVISAEYINTPIDTIICLEGTQMLGSLIAEQLSEADSHSVNYGNDVCVITPEVNSNGQMIFRDNAQHLIWNKQILLLISLASTGKTVKRSVECLQYYSGRLAAVTSIFSAIDEIGDIHVDSVFIADELPDYMTHSALDCPMCHSKQKVDALVNDHGYSKI